MRENATMGVKAAILTNNPDTCPAWWSGVGGCAAVAEHRIMRSGPGALARLLAYRPDVVVSGEFGAAAFQAALCRAMSPRLRFVLCVADTPRKSGLRGRLVLDRADAVLAEGGAVAHAMEQLAGSIGRVFAVAMPFDLEPFLDCGQARPAPDAYRMVHAGDLSPQSGAADLLAGVAACAEQQPRRAMEIWWAGDGDLAGVLAAQPLPPNLSQRFLGRLDGPGLARAFGQCGLLVAPSLADNKQAQVAQGMAAGLPVLGSMRSRIVRQLVREGVNGWLFDPLRPANVVQAVQRALDVPAAQLDLMREQARALVRPSPSQEFASQLGDAIAAALAAPDRALARTPARTSPAPQGLRQLARSTSAR